MCESGNKVSNHLYKDSKDIEKSFPHFFGEPVEVHCGQKPANASTNCQPLKEVCLFDIKNDPCEYNNLAPSMQSVSIYFYFVAVRFYYFTSHLKFISNLEVPGLFSSSEADFKGNSFHMHSSERVWADCAKRINFN